MKVAVTGLRGFPDIQGGIETHSLNLYPLLAERGVDVTVLGRSPYLKSKVLIYKGVKILALPCPRISSIETVVHTFISIIYCGFVSRPNLVHIHAVGPGLFVPLARILGLKVVFTHHGEDYHRQKWGKFASLLLRLGERFGAQYANAVISISQSIKVLLEEKYNVKSYLIPNGVKVEPVTTDFNCLEQFAIERFRYILIVGRLVPEKRHHDLISAFLELRTQAMWPDIKLVIVGSADHESDYTKALASRICQIDGIVMAGFQTGASLSQLYRWAGVFCLPSSHEGLPISLLEAMSAGCPVVASNIVSNLELGLNDAEYFALGDIVSLSQKLGAALSLHFDGYCPESNRHTVAERYNWQAIAENTLDVYRIVSGSNA